MYGDWFLQQKLNVIFWRENVSHQENILTIVLCNKIASPETR